MAQWFCYEVISQIEMLQSISQAHLTSFRLACLYYCTSDMFKHRTVVLSVFHFSFMQTSSPSRLLDQHRALQHWNRLTIYPTCIPNEPPVEDLVVKPRLRTYRADYWFLTLLHLHQIALRPEFSRTDSFGHPSPILSLCSLHPVLLHPTLSLWPIPRGWYPHEQWCFHFYPAVDRNAHCVPHTAARRGRQTHKLNQRDNNRSWSASQFRITVNRNMFSPQ